MQRESQVIPHPDIPHVLTLVPDVFTDHRGSFVETWQLRTLLTNWIECPTFLQGNLSVSAPWVLRGLHYQLNNPQGKLIQCTAGSIFDVALDLRPHSATFGKWAAQYLDDRLHKAAWIPPGFAHGFLALSGGSTVVYNCTSYYDEESARAINPYSCRIAWPLGEYLPGLISDKDRAAPTLGAAMEEIRSR